MKSGCPIVPARGRGQFEDERDEHPGDSQAQQGADQNRSEIHTATSLIFVIAVIGPTRQFMDQLLTQFTHRFTEFNPNCEPQAVKRGTV